MSAIVAINVGVNVVDNAVIVIVVFVAHVVANVAIVDIEVAAAEI